MLSPRNTDIRSVSVITLSTEPMSRTPPEYTFWPQKPSSITLSSIESSRNAFFITNGDPMPFWDFVRASSTEAGFPVNKKDVWVVLKGVALAIALVLEWIVWAMSLGNQKSTSTRGGMRFSCLTRTNRIDKTKERLGYNPTVDLEEGIRRGVGCWLIAKSKKYQ